MTRYFKRVIGVVVAASLAGCGNSTPPAGGTSAERRCHHYQAERQPFFGDLHVHTKYSLDASTQGTSLGPHDAYRFALGERVGIQPHDANGMPLRFTQLTRPLDFAAVTDHAEFFGETEICTNPIYLEYNSP